ncbi:MAG: KEOPS complex subunit Pcc1 [Candidatus Thorarchaeota archaeon]|jgi:tRNA threonylcarbamoyladenosine modification (KEOPS) complex  Pcc1 subunit
MMAEINLEFPSSAEAERISKSLSPDNVPLPPGLRIDTQVRRNRIALKIECERGLDSLRATLEDIMSAIDLALRTARLVE